jgi:cyclic beta-1,2-glucan synthetase
VQLLSNGRYHVMVTSSGGGYSRWNDLALTRWREDTTCDHWGSFCYLRDVDLGPHLVHRAPADQWQRGERYEAIFSEGRAEFRRRDVGIDTHTEIVVSPEDDIELRRLRITNSSRIAPHDRGHQLCRDGARHGAGRRAASGVQQAVRADRGARAAAVVLATRRRRSPEDETPWMFQLMAVHGVRSPGNDDARISAITHETDRARFIGRGNDLSCAAGLARGRAAVRARPVRCSTRWLPAAARSRWRPTRA